ncbi:suppressor of fused domain protein [Occultella kanbiaonis]|uniref:suppressor of fused domain protein n=1 Tax=Occultella kanbiaonis TaxID=2675754 RepID=UPI0012B6CEFC|nr:suppressor of fused domain protein [Occultella kanbiaonis]
MTTDPTRDQPRPAPTTRGGDPVFEHAPAGITPSAPAPRDEVRRTAALAHLTEFLGDDHTVLTEKVSAGIHLDVLVFRPSEEVPYVTLVTAGMSDVPMNTPATPGGDRMELMIGLHPGWPGIDPLDAGLLADPANFWPIKLLKDVARIPSTYDSYVAWGHTIADDHGDLFAPGGPYTGAIVGPPVGYLAQIMRAPTPAGEIDYLAVFPLRPEEMAYKIAVPGGGDALLDRLMDARVLAVAERDRPGVVAGPPPWSVHLLLSSRPDHLGEVLDQAVPNRAAQFAKERRQEGVVPVGDAESVRLRLFRGRLTATALSEDGGAGPLRESVLPAVAEHAGVVTLTPERDGDGDPLMAVMAMATMLTERNDVIAVWLPHQQHVTTAEQFRKDAGGGAVVTYRVHPSEVPEGRAVITRGFAALGGREVLFRDPNRTHKRLTTRLQGALASTGDAGDRAPRAGQQLKYVGSRYELVEAAHPLTQEPVLELVRSAKRRGFFGRG